LWFVDGAETEFVLWFVVFLGWRGDGDGFCFVLDAAPFFVVVGGGQIFLEVAALGFILGSGRFRFLLVAWGTVDLTGVWGGVLLGGEVDGVHAVDVVAVA
jgi:hypothetical protein